MSRHNTFDWNMIEHRIRPHVKALIDAGYTTTGSCGHDMWISLKIVSADLPKLAEDLQRLGYSEFEIEYKTHFGFHKYEYARITFGGVLKGDGKPYDLVLLKVDPETHPLFFVIKDKTRNIDRTVEDDTYFYNEHTCPVNWVDDIIAVVSRGDDDPHGFAAFVRRLHIDEETNEAAENEEWLTLFPETIST